jgi:hypothetical protein
VSTQTLTSEGMVDLGTGELTEEPGEVPELPAGLAAAPDVVAAQAAAERDVLEGELDEELDEERDDRPAVLASA